MTNDYPAFALVIQIQAKSKSHLHLYLKSFTFHLFNVLYCSPFEHDFLYLFNSLQTNGPKQLASLGAQRVAWVNESSSSSSNPCPNYAGVGYMNFVSPLWSILSQILSMSEWVMHEIAWGCTRRHVAASPQPYYCQMKHMTYDAQYGYGYRHKYGDQGYNYALLEI